MNNPPASLAEHLDGFSAVNLKSECAASALEKIIRSFGPVRKLCFSTFREALSFLLPLKSFTTRFLVIGVDGWSILVTDMNGENCHVDAFGISRATLCAAIGLHLRRDRRELHLFEDGHTVREIQSLKDGDRWYFREQGASQPFEDPEEYIRKKEDRLSVEAINRYFKAYTGLRLPDWKSDQFAQIYGLERSTQELRVKITHFETMDDL